MVHPRPIFALENNKCVTKNNKNYGRIIPALHHRRRLRHHVLCLRNPPVSPHHPLLKRRCRDGLKNRQILLADKKKVVIFAVENMENKLS